MIQRNLMDEMEENKDCMFRSKNKIKTKFSTVKPLYSNELNVQKQLDHGPSVLTSCINYIVPA